MRLTIEPCPILAISSSSEAAPAATSPRSAPRSSASPSRASRMTRLGGTCLHRGCIPTKALLHTARPSRGSRHAGAFGVVAPSRGSTSSRRTSYKSRSSQERQGVEYLFKKNNVECCGAGSLYGRTAWRSRRTAKQVIGSPSPILLATGSAPRASRAPFDGKRVLDSDHILELASVPRTG